MTEFLLPYLLLTQYTPNNVSDDYFPQYIFNITRNMELNSELVIFHDNYFATLTCQNQGITNLTCYLKNRYIEIYREKKFESTNTEEKEYRKNDAEKFFGPFVIVFHETGIKQILIPQHLDCINNEIQLVRDLLNVLWINKVTSDNGLYYLEDNDSTYKCPSTLKVMVVKDNNTGKNDKFMIDRVDGFNSMKFNYKKMTTFDDCKNYKKEFNSDEYALLRQYTVNRVIMSAQQFTSFNEELLLLKLTSTRRNTICVKSSLDLHGIELSNDKFLSIKNPNDEFIVLP